MTVIARPVVAMPVGAPAVGLLVQALVLVALAATVGLGGAGWLAGAGYAVGVWLVVSQGLRRSGLLSFGAANYVTLLRASLTCGVVALVAESARGVTRLVPLC